MKATGLNEAGKTWVNMKKIIITTVFTMGLILVGVGSMAAQSSSVAGEWSLDYDGELHPSGSPVATDFSKLTFSVDGERLGVDSGHDCVGRDGTIKGNDISFSCACDVFIRNLVIFTFTGKVNGDSMSGTVKVAWTRGSPLDDDYDNTWSAKRVPPPNPKP
ncbi:MAG: hypothetical protein ACKVQJ_02230 [Pyrinomonadaceae bacterium]